MTVLIIVLVIIGAVIIGGLYNSSKTKKQRDEIIERRKRYVESVSPTARIIVNNGIHLFFKDDQKKQFGVDESGKLYSFSRLTNVQRYKDGISFMHRDAVTLCIGKDYGHQDTTIALDTASVGAIYNEMMPVLRANLKKVLKEHGVTPTHEYELDGEIWGCDINSKQFYCVYGSPQVFQFSDLIRVTVEDLRNNSLYDGSYIIHVYTKEDVLEFGENEFEIHIKTPDATYNNLLAMFKGIRNRQ